MRKLMVLAVWAGLAAAPEAAACTTFCLKSGKDLVFGKNYDWNVEEGMLVVNKRHVAKTAGDAGQNPARWVSKHGSVTFNQFGREEPNGGMNEAGLVVELMWLEQTRYPEAGNQEEVGCLEWIQYQLDNFATLAEVLEQASKLRIVSEVPLHYLVCDRSGACATVEFLEGRFVAHSGETLPVAALTNSPYSESVEALKRQAAGDVSSLGRFVTAARMVQGYKPEASRSAVDYAFEILDRAAQGQYTQWSIVYDLQRLEIHFKTRQLQKVRTVRLGAFDYSCGTAVKILDLGADLQGDVTERLVEYTTAANRKLIGQVYAKVDFLAGIPAETLDEYARLPDAMSCREGSLERAAPPARSGSR
jgi:choloylglycine hydrolase